MQDYNQHINQLLIRCKNGERNAQTEIYKLYYKAMYNTAFRILKDSFEAEDVMQESFLNAFKKLDTFHGEVTFGAWLKRIVINKSLTQLKKSKRYEEIKLEVTPDENIADEQIEYTSLKVTDILNNIKLLKDNYRIALTLNLIEGYDNEEISDIMKISYENTRTTISRAKKKLRQLLLVTT